MARIRTIKPEFPHSESMGAVSRDARLLFILLWTIADDSGRLRGNAKLLSSLLFPYDADAKDRLPVWMAELHRQKCLVSYDVDGHTYVQITNWENHQKIDRPSGSKFPAFDPSRESSRGLANNLEGSSLDQRIKEGIKGAEDLDQGREGSRELANAREKTVEDKTPAKKFAKPSLEEVRAFMEEQGCSIWYSEGSKFWNFYESKGWLVGKSSMKDWKAAARGWISRSADVKKLKTIHELAAEAFA